MSINFKIKDFLHPLKIYKLKSFLEKSQWYEPEKMGEIQYEILIRILKHSYKNVPYYRKLFDVAGIKVNDIKSLKDLDKIPVLTKDDLKCNFNSLTAKDVHKYKPHLYKTTGTTGEPVPFYLDISSQVLEFCYYWRYWSWSGYSLRKPFAEFALHPFIEGDITRLFFKSHLTNRIIVNPSMLSRQNIGSIYESLRKNKTEFIKGSPSTLYAYALLLEREGVSMPLKSVFTTGELVLPSHRAKIEEIFECRLVDSYGHMERTVAICQCPEGSYHINSEYGVLEVNKNSQLSDGNKTVGTVIGTTLHNLAMPLIRYELTDLLEVGKNGKCRCGRGLPVVDKILGRTQQIIVTPDERFLTNLFILFDDVKNVKWLQMIQESINHITLEYGPDTGFNQDELSDMISKLRTILGDSMIIDLHELNDSEVIERKNHKYLPVISKIDIELN